MVLTLLIITRSTMNLQRYITLRHLDKMAKVTMLTGMIVSYAYLTEFFAAWYGGNLYERYHFINRATGPLCLVLLPDGALQRGDAADCCGPKKRGRTSPSFSSCRSWSTSACGLNAS